MDFSAVIAEELNLEVWRVAKALELMDQVKRIIHYLNTIVNTNHDDTFVLVMSVRVGFFGM